ncbi:regulatory protein brlA [Aspergillus granulosus]|uniref:Regulatory protein brlA n=1 Tax=Aspergillus granulosus TaxID=176169 RepID=A0ABR4H1G3_9EURO
MRHQHNLSDRLTVEVDCSSLGSNECPSMTSSFSPLDSPTPTPTSLYSHGSLESPGWHEAGSFPSHTYDRTAGSTPMRSAFRLTGMASTESLGLPYGSMEPQERVPMADFLSGYDENMDQMWLPSEAPKTYDQVAQGLAYHHGMHQYPTMARNNNNYRHQPATYLPESTTNPCLSRSIFQQPERGIPTSMSMSNIWMPLADSIAPQTIAPSQVAPVTPPPSYTEFTTSLSAFKQHSPTTPVRSCSLGTGSGADTPMSRLSGGPCDYLDDLQQSPGYQNGLQRPHRMASRKTLRRQNSKQSLMLENLPPIIRQVQFKCKEPGCNGRFKRQEHLKRHMKSHSKEKPHVCWVPGCHRAFSRSDNLNAHYTKTHSKRGGRNRYVATLDENSPDYDPDFRGQLTPDGRPIYGTKLEEPIPGAGDIRVDPWED